MRTDLLSILRCPEDGTPLSVASDPLVEEINAAIRMERLMDRGGKPVVQAIDCGLVRAAGDVLYPIIDQIPVLLVDESIALDQLGGSLARS
jgi:uncharacterized protein YbaR (Trm112 family)